MDEGRAQRRWDNDPIGQGVGDGRTFAPHVQRLQETTEVLQSLPEPAAAEHSDHGDAMLDNLTPQSLPRF